MISTHSRNIAELAKVHVGEDIWVLAAGASMDYVEPSFFDNKITVGVNRVNKKYDCTYLVSKDSRGFGEVAVHRKAAKIILSRHELGDPGRPFNRANFDHWVFDHVGHAYPPDVTVVGSERIVVSDSTITSAIHIAAFLGASSIIICGHDCGKLNGCSCFTGYYDNIVPYQGDLAKYGEWVMKIESQTVHVVKRIREVYGVSVHSLNPFINFNLEGNTFQSTSPTACERATSFRLLRSGIRRAAGIFRKKNT